MRSYLDKYTGETAWRGPSPAMDVRSGGWKPLLYPLTWVSTQCLFKNMMVWDEFCPPKFICESPNPQYLRMQLFGDIAFRVVSNLQVLIRTGSLLSHVTGVLRRKGDYNTNMRRGATIWRHREKTALHAQGRGLGRSQPSPHLAVQLRASSDCGKIYFCCGNHSVCGALFWRPSRLTDVSCCYFIFHLERHIQFTSCEYWKCLAVGKGHSCSVWNSVLPASWRAEDFYLQYSEEKTGPKTLKDWGWGVVTILMPHTSLAV